MATGTRNELTGLLGIAPEETLKAEDGSLFLAMKGLGPTPPSGRLLRGLTPWLDGQDAHHVFLLTERKWREPWSGTETVQSYQELVHWERGADGGRYRGTAWKGTALKMEDLVQAFRMEPHSLVDYAARRVNGAVISNREPLRLRVHYVPKPWGREGWYTGIEKRGVSCVQSGTGSTELPYAVGMFPAPLLSTEEREPILLKTLEPHPDEVFGDLYLEVHDKKWETYVVLEVDPGAWPDGVGNLRAGLAPQRIEAYRAEHGDGWSAALTRDLRERIGEYEAVRNEIDGLLETALRGDGEDPAQPVLPARHAALLAELPSGLREREAAARNVVESYLGSIPMRVGDVVSLPPGVLHSLQHGVKVVEFQTPTYERLIAMFAQRVITQSQWDTERALERMEKTPYVPAAPVPQIGENGYSVERAVTYPEFMVDRVRLEAMRSAGQDTGGGYRLLFVVEGMGQLTLPGGSSHTLVKQDALILPATMGPFEVAAGASGPLVYLDARPNPEGTADSAD
ncbi:MAG: hypothetical protein O7A67_10960 [SAR324 cluster bacterium]|nr:hypothetical protein [SAR324 cluster bacterium]